ncbi:unnamed protein product [Onchocerca ochengi]|uniref:Voltage-gated hydrogen channel 1 n=1 Tax=Onchocerca ochengi TaxID=42157 RepID=A0A182EDI0_ONCOC|nr:unnamed protein product [Onchocerca ochengi]
MQSDRFKRKEVKTLRQRWIMKHKDRTDDIPNCPSIESIVNMPTPEIPQSDKVATDGTVTDTSITKLPDDSQVESLQATTGREISSKSGETTTIPIQPARRRHRGRRKKQRRSQRNRKYRKRDLTSSDSSSGFVIQNSASERRDDIPMCPDIEHICQLDQSELDDDMNVHRFSHALIQLFDDFLLLMTNLAQFLKDHPRPATIASFIVASYLIICYLEISIAALVELIAQIIWPIFHAMLLFIERFSINFGSFMHSSDDIITGAYCDVAEIWCKNFQMMCADRCSFFSMALERLRTK